MSPSSGSPGDGSDGLPLRDGERRACYRHSSWFSMNPQTWWRDESKSILTGPLWNGNSKIIPGLGVLCIPPSFTCRFLNALFPNLCWDVEDQTPVCSCMRLVLGTASGRVWSLAEPQVQGLLPHCRGWGPQAHVGAPGPLPHTYREIERSFKSLWNSSRCPVNEISGEQAWQLMFQWKLEKWEDLSEQVASCSPFIPASC